MHKSESIILGKRQLGEADLLVTLFTKDGGKVKGVARHAKKSKKRFGGMLELGYVVNTTYRSKFSSDLATINEVTLISPTAHRFLDLPTTYALWLALEISERFLQDSDQSIEKYELLHRYILTIHEGRLNRGILLFFLLKWISLAGYLPADLAEASADIRYKLKPTTIETIKKVVKGDVNSDINDVVLLDSLSFVFHYCKQILGRPLKMGAYKGSFAELK